MVPATSADTQTNHGKTANAIYNLLLNRQDQDQPISQTQIGKELGLGVATVHRHLKKLIDSGLVMQTKGKSTSSYKVSSSDSITRSVSPIGSTEVLQYQEQISSLDSSSTSVPSIGLTDRVNFPRWWEPTSVPPLDTGKRLGFGSVELLHLVAYFEFFVLPRAERKITDDHRRGWLKAARRMLVVKGYALSDVVQVISWIFEYHDGQLPGTIRCRDRHRKLTRLDQISWYFPRLLEEMTLYRGRPRPEPEDDILDVAQGQELADQIETLTRLWKVRMERENRGAEIPEEALDSWRETFRVSLVGRKIPFADLQHVLEALANPELELSVARERYQHPVRIWHPRSEWQGLKMDVRLAEARALLNKPVEISVREKNEDGEYIVDTSARYAEEDAVVASHSSWDARSPWESTSWEDRREMARQSLQDYASEVA